MFCNTCLTTTKNTITLHVKNDGGHRNFVCGLYINDNNRKITDDWKDFCTEIGYKGCDNLTLEVIDGGENIVEVTK